MSISENSTLLPTTRENDGSYPSLDGHSYGRGDLAVNSYEKSPYTDPDFVSLDVGVNQTRFRVHRVVLSQSPELEVKPFSKLWGDKTNDTLPLPDLDEATAHTLVHYLYSAKYQSLQSYEATKNGAVADYKLGTCVYCAAIRYKLPGLAELAKEKITSSGEDLTILDILDVAREHAFLRLPEDENWFPAYLEGAIKGAATEDPELFMKPGFVDRMGDGRFRQVVMKAIVNSYSRAPPTTTERQVESRTVASETKPVEVPATSEQKQGDSESEKPSDRKIEDVGIETEDAKDLEEDEKSPRSVKPTDLSFDAIEPTQPAPAAPESVTDEVGFGSSKTYLKLGKRTESSIKIESASETKAPVPMHKRNDSAVQTTETVPIRPSVAVEEEVVTPTESAHEASPLVVDGTSTSTTTTSKKNKKKKKKNPSVTVVAVGS